MMTRIDTVPVAPESRIGRIPVRNLWLLMLYASDLTRVRGAFDALVDDDLDNLPDLGHAFLHVRSNVGGDATSLSAIVIVIWYSPGSADVSTY
jgi:hypothetical protein